VVLEDTGELLHGQVGQSGANGLECGVVGCEDGEVFGAIDGVDQVRLHQSASGVAQASIHGSHGGIGWYSEDLVDDMDNTSGKVHILGLISTQP